MNVRGAAVCAPLGLAGCDGAQAAIAMVAITAGAYCRYRQHARFLLLRGISRFYAQTGRMRSRSKSNLRKMAEVASPGQQECAF
jgi:hypothetical protein